MSRSAFLYVVALAALCAAAAGAVWYYTMPPEVARRGDAAVTPLPLSAPTFKSQAQQEPELPAGVRINFNDVTAAVGIQFQHFDGHTDREYIMETLGSGLGW